MIPRPKLNRGGRRPITPRSKRNSTPEIFHFKVFVFILKCKSRKF